ncbi:hypothetical protein NGF19_16965 [Streptomyces sp. RY43-2]|uniref:Uncharacterized protein n=1 Tax=Streptomyces macrolidinus TaxID=2952607 RepID=A0ABT0ZFW7_9ACTN|nr:hypothetical protein [Streptomyces macrolidinus]MCN9242466.1 hypothetical protein [Streptomyces macrolidinus]
MREKPDGGAGAGAGASGKKKRLDLSVPQVAGSALAAVVAAKLASSFGVYGTILGAGVVSLVATCGGSVLQHVFRRTGEQLRDVAVRGRSREEQGPVGPGEFTEGTVYRARTRRWRRPVVAAAVVFGVTMAGITTYELVSGSSFSGGSSTTTVRDVLTGHSESSSKQDPSPSPSWTPSRGTDAPSGGATRGGTPSAGEGTGAPTGRESADPAKSPAPGATTGPDAGSGSPSPTATPTPGASVTPPAPDADSGSRSGDPGPDGPAGP